MRVRTHTTTHTHHHKAADAHHNTAHGHHIPPPSPPPPPSPCVVVQEYCNPHALWDSDAANKPFNSRLSSPLVERIYQTSLGLMNNLEWNARSGYVQNMDHYAQFERMLRLESRSNNCCIGYTCAATSTSNQTLGECILSGAPSMPPTPPIAPPAAPSGDAYQTGVVIALVFASLMSAGGVACFFGKRARMPPNDDENYKTPLVAVSKASMAFSNTDLTHIPRHMRI